MEINFLQRNIRQYQFISQLNSKHNLLYKAFNQKLKELCIIKVYKSGNPKKDQIRASQVKILKLCQTQHIVKLIDYFQEQGFHFHVFQYCGDGTLQQYVHKRKKLPQQEAIMILNQIVNGVDCLHQLNIIHRNLKPSHIIQKSGKFKISNFSFLKSLQSLEMTQSVLGTQQYMAIQRLQHKKYGFKADVWSIGIIYYYLLYGFLPFMKQKNRQDFIKSIHAKKYSFNGILISNNSKKFILSCLQIQVDKRMNINQVRNHPIFRQEKFPISTEFLPQPTRFEQIITELKYEQSNDQVEKLNEKLYQDNNKLQSIEFEQLPSLSLLPQKQLKKSIQIAISKLQYLQYQFYSYTKIIILQKNKFCILVNYIIIINQQCLRQQLSQSRNLTSLRLMIGYRCLQTSWLFVQIFKNKKNIFNFKYFKQYCQTNQYQCLNLQFHNLYNRCKDLYLTLSQSLNQIQSKFSVIIADFFKKIFNPQDFYEREKFINGFEGIDFSSKQHINSTRAKFQKIKKKQISGITPCKSLYTFLFVLQYYELLASFNNDGSENKSVQIIIDKLREIQYLQKQDQYWKEQINKIIKNKP